VAVLKKKKKKQKKKKKIILRDQKLGFGILARGGVIKEGNIWRYSQEHDPAESPPQKCYERDLKQTSEPGGGSVSSKRH